MRYHEFMKIGNNLKTSFVVVLTVLMVGMIMSCSSTKNIANPTPKQQQTSADLYKQKVVANAHKEQFLTAKAKVELTMGDKDISLSGNLRMKRGDVIQISMSFPIVGEVCRMEFTKNEVLIVDRINARFVKVPYDKVDFLRSANLDYNVLESIFWNEVFYPGTTDVNSKLGEYTVASSGSHTLLSLTTAPKLDYSFLTISESGLVDRTTVSPKNSSDKSNLVCIYSNFVKYTEGKFPSSFKVTFAGDQQTYALDFDLSSISNDSKWTTRTTLSSKYKQMDADVLLKSLIP